MTLYVQPELSYMSVVEYQNELIYYATKTINMTSILYLERVGSTNETSIWLLCILLLLQIPFFCIYPYACSIFLCKKQRY
jgi:hypothetical protein